MKITAKLSLIIVITMFAAYSMFAGENTIQLKTTLHGDGCKAKIEKGMKTHKGIIKTNADVKTKIVTVTFNDEVTSRHDIEEALGDMGYSVEKGGCCKEKAGAKCEGESKAGHKCEGEKEGGCCKDKKKKT